MTLNSPHHTEYLSKHHEAGCPMSRFWDMGFLPTQQVPA
jgi:hypothetical protein